MSVKGGSVIFPQLKNMKRFLREPLLHFVLLGGFFFAIYHFVAGGAADTSRHISISRGQIEHMTAIFARTWQRQPVEDELQDLIKSHIRDEILFREGVALGLDRDDPVIRNRVRVKMETLAEDAATPGDPGDAILQAWLERNAKAFAVAPRYTLAQIYFNPARHGTRLKADFMRALDMLSRHSGDALPDNIGDATMLPEQIDDMPAIDVAKIFGADFVAALAPLPLSTWQGPVRSTYGEHLVRVIARSEARPRPLVEVRDAVLREWSAERRREAKEKLYADLLKRYTVEVEPPKAAAQAFVPGDATRP